MNRFICAACLSLAAMGTASAQAPGLSGSWEGDVTQIGPGTYRGGYPAKMTLSGASGKIDYPSLSHGFDRKRHAAALEVAGRCG